MGRKAVHASAICARRLPRSFQGQRKESLSCSGEGFTLWREVLKIMEIALKWLFFLWVRVLSCAFFAELRADLRANREFFLQSYSATKFGLHFCFLRSFFILPRRYFLRGGVWLNFFCRFFCGDFEVSRGKASRNFLTPVRPCEHEKSVADNESGGFLSGAIFIAYGNSRSFYSSRGAKSGGAVFFPLPKKKKNFHIWRKTKNFALRLFDARILSLYVE